MTICARKWNYVVQMKFRLIRCGVTYICVSKKAILGSYNGLLTVWHQTTRTVTKPLSESIFAYCSLDSLEQISWNQSTYIFIKKNVFENVVCKMVLNMSRPQRAFWERTSDFLWCSSEVHPTCCLFHPCKLWFDITMPLLLICLHIEITFYHATKYICGDNACSTICVFWTNIFVISCLI